MPKIAARMAEEPGDAWVAEREMASPQQPAAALIEPQVAPVPRMTAATPDAPTPPPLATPAAPPEQSKSQIERSLAPAPSALVRRLQAPAVESAPVETSNAALPPPMESSNAALPPPAAPALKSAAPAAPSIAPIAEPAAPPEGSVGAAAPPLGLLLREAFPKAESDETPLAESAPATARSAPPSEKQATSDAVRASSDEFTLVKVFYGTDREALQAGASPALPASWWFWITAVSAAATIAVAMACWALPGSRSLRWASAFGLIATAGLGVVTIQARQQPQPADGLERRIYGNRRGALEMGVCEVSIPKRHQVGAVERPTILKFEFRENPLKHVVLQSVRQESFDEFYAQLKSRVEASYQKQAFVFVHGFNVSFDSAARRTAQIAYDLKFDGAPIFFSWPSQGGLLGYTVDENNVVWAVPHLKEFLAGVAARSGAEAVHLVAHSMGNRALTSALREMLYELNDKCPRFREVVLTAPDIDADVFRRDIAPAILRTADRVTLYASSNDEALVLSKKVHGYARAGDSGAGLIVIPGMDTIDVSAVDSSLLGHSYYGNNLTVLADLFDLLHEARSPEHRPWLRPMQVGQLRYWIFKQIEAASRSREQR